MAKAFDSYFVRQCAPTLAGVKVGNLFCLEVADGVLLCNILARWNRALNPKGVFAQVVAEKRGRSFIYVYRYSALESLKESQEIKSFLKGFGYGSFDVESMLKNFQRRMNVSVCFPHEVGIFLGYPLEDVRDFIVHGGKNYKQIGCWKVYHDVSNCMHISEVYKKCKKVLCDQFEQGVTLERLTVAS